MKNLRKKKRPKSQKKVEERKRAEGVVRNEEENTKKRVLEALVDAFSLSSMREAPMAYDIAGGNPDRASEILRKGLSEDSYSCCSSSCSGGSSGGGSSSSSSGMELGLKEEGEQNCGEGVVVGGFKGGRQKKKVVASTGTVSTVLGKEYVGRNSGRNKGFSANDGAFDMEEAEQFLCSMIGEDCDLNLAVVRDVLCE
ncbi:unnamed protein product [Sphenostylis stenocarpa]|uniref:At5g58720/SDE5-like UBA-like domain-containing protein n=1 Tax=Sphenostylis stenocarpa TaxID=92480 RepID=A0AA86SLH7_9FABA|nr:unnamed protein product [Sphenostylis stenocarpa]